MAVTFLTNEDREELEEAIAEAAETGGVDGITPHIGTNGNWWIGTEDTGVKAEGVDGTDGTATDEQVAAWLDAHPEATTTVLDGSITLDKLAEEVLTALDQGLSSAEKDVMLSLFKNIAYTADMSAKVAELEALWSVSYKVSYSLTGATASNDASAVIENGNYVSTITPDSGYSLTNAEVSVTMGGVDITSDVYTNGVINIASVTGNIVITVVAKEIPTYSITNVLDGVTNSNEATKVSEGDYYSANLTWDEAYSLNSIVITMGGVDVTEDVYGEGNILITEVTGDVVITATAKEIQKADTTVVLDTVNTGGLNRLGQTVTNDYVANVSVSKAYDIGENGASMNGVIFAGADTTISTTLQSKMRVCLYDSTGAVIAYSPETSQAINNTGTEGIVGFVGTTTGATQVRFSIFTDYMDDSYIYFADTGNVVFAGKNTPYYGMANIDGTLAVA